jgi:hypothetical protein
MCSDLEYSTWKLAYLTPVHSQEAQQNTCKLHEENYQVIEIITQLTKITRSESRFFLFIQMWRYGKLTQVSKLGSASHVSFKSKPELQVYCKTQ